MQAQKPNSYLIRSSLAFVITPSQHNEDYETVVRYIDSDILQSGWLIGEEAFIQESGDGCC